MTQMIILDNAQVLSMKVAYEITREQSLSPYQRLRRNKFYSLRQTIYDKPNTLREHTLNYNLITFLAHHKSNKPFIKRLYRSRRKSNTAWMYQIDKALKQLFNL